MDYREKMLEELGNKVSLVHKTGKSCLCFVNKPIKVYKKTYIRARHWPVWSPSRTVVTELMLIPGSVFVMHSQDKKCRANMAYVLENQPSSSALYKDTFRYISGRVVTPDQKNAMMWFSPHKPENFLCVPYEPVCSPGIHFFFEERYAQSY